MPDDRPASLSARTGPELLIETANGSAAAIRLGPAEVAQCYQSQLLGLLEDAIDGERVVLTEAAHTALAGYRVHAAERSVALEARACALAGELQASNIDSRMLKGLANANLDYRFPEHRQFNDVDILVRGASIGAAVTILERHGFRRAFAEPTPGFDERVGKGVAMTHRDGTSVDLHRTLALGYYGSQIDLDAVWSETQDFVLADTKLHALPPIGRMVHCALHMALAPDQRWMHRWDLRTIAAAQPSTTVDALDEAARAWRCAAPVAAAFRAAVRAMPDDPHIGRFRAWAESYRPSVADRLAYRTYHGRGAHSKVRSLTAVAGFTTWEHRLMALRYTVPLRHDG